MYKTLIDTQNVLIKDIQIPNTFIPNPTDSDYDIGYIDRYFIQRANDKMAFVFEIDSTSAREIYANPYWKTIIITWRISGPINVVKNEKTGMIIDNGVYNDNIKAINKAKKDIPNIRSYILNPLQFHRNRNL